MYNGLEIKNKTTFVVKHIGMGLLAVGILLLLGQISISPKFFPTSIIVTVVSLLLQVIGWKEPFWFLADMDTFSKG